MSAPPPPPPQHIQQHGGPQQQPMVVVQQQPAISLNLGGGMPSMPEICPHCHQQVLMIHERSPNCAAICLAILAVLFLGSMLLGYAVCIWLLYFSDCVNISFRCPACKKVARTIEN